MLKIGQIVDGKYKVLNVIGKGGMSVVYLAMNEKANKQWAIKEVRKDSKSNVEVVKQGLIAETDLLKKLKHPNLPSIVDVIEAKDTFLIVMDYIEGVSLKVVLKEYGAQSQENVIEWGKQLCDVLAYLHSREPAIIYRDMKPSNIMLKPDGNICLIDFGTAREYKHGNSEDTAVLGTKGYAPPEQYGGLGQTDARTDIFSLGATMYHLVTGHNPANPPYEMYPIRKWNQNLSPGLEKIILKCTMSNPDERYQSAVELRYALEHYDELDHAHRAGQKKKIAAFATLATLTLVSAGASIYCRAMENQARTSSYDAFISRADSQAKLSNYDDAYEIYREAIRVAPDRPEAYSGVLKMYSRDGIFTKQEAQYVADMLTSTDSGKRSNNKSYFEASSQYQPEYAAFCYDLAFAYYLQYTEKDNVQSASECEGNYQLALDYFKAVANSSGATPLQSNCAAHLGALSDDEVSREKSNLPNTVGVANMDYVETFATMEAIIDDNLAAEAGYEDFTLKLCYKIACICGDWRVSFKNAGVQEKELARLVSKVEAYADEHIERTEEREDLFAKLETQCEIAKKEIEACYD